MEDLAIGSVLGDGDLGPDAASDGPKVDSGIALVLDDCAAIGLRRAGDEGESSESVEEHGCSGA